MKFRALIPALVLGLFVTPAVFAQKADDLLGQWYTEDNDSKVNVTKVNGKYTGQILWLDEPLYDKDDKEAGKPKHDRKNPEKRRRKAPIVGLVILENFVFDAGDKEWNSGTIYDPDVGKTYKCVATMLSSPGSEGGVKLNVRGYIGFPALGRTTVWYRVPKEDYVVIESE